ncbi:hypothetical protein COW36_08795 [bacterium (Candidatus Blackallbacteria) CG17_big_fil_post_rev_8_21_14_2_50_48_46]|uniref:Uncharacterized protein n=1 Tax=bacterium (Candidatus Blackallbacteria) CG17_big_fil_post_rev_8_21_14_2_50_48_46 TaxID=2014261 RepID=A0A2M7G6E8_9BACT|nr:MAG: hypothetical protein COW64_06095 [bacterium (Candidatus Blackallbacteria) CG18_big_fil_WC_8_21_14_2_50_49_26]PIW17582.1 MAG: hypothetical protein COW36_08795 [bacterium (Candidatus Blackallbacteria) CG17_big_fil_post_rev_8_21_14_2_50_48_46]PIW48437.1 MAG: hypothetical protein COW20_10145 [bacterium (Candidatus Blackallbacteria) CG13_big_fil_rev_8_21_14_2_50_49_14]
MSSYSNLVDMRSLIPKVIDKITMDNWFRNSDSLESLLDLLLQRFNHGGKKVSQIEYLEIANQAEQMSVELVMSLSYGDLVQLLSENPWILTTEAELNLISLFEEKLGKSTVASLIAVVLCEHFYSTLIQTVECLI